MSRAHRSDGGFVLSLVIFAVAALSIAGTALFLVVQSEGAMADSGADTSAAYHLANAGLARYMGENFGMPRPEVTYEMGGGTVTVRATFIAAQSRTDDVYLITAAAELRNRLSSRLSTRREVSQFARLQRQPFTPTAAGIFAADDVKTRNVTISGADACGVGPAIAGVGISGTNDVRGTISGSPPVMFSPYPALVGGVGLGWETMNDPALPFDYEIPSEGWPNFLWGVPPDEYPTIRVDGNLNATWLRSGRGLLVVTGELNLGHAFSWDGVILAGSIRARTTARAQIRGVLLTGFDGQQSSLDLKEFQVDYDSCSVLAASQGIALLTPVSNTWWESDN